MMNEKFDVPSLIIDKVGADRYKYFKIMYKTMDQTNRIDFVKLGVSDVTVKRIRSLFRKEGIIEKVKLTPEIGFARYLNPYLINKNNLKNQELEEAFRHNRKKSKSGIQIPF